MNYGYFDLENREYVITNPKTPVKWINYLGTINFGGIIDHTGGMLLCRDDPALNRMYKYIPQLPASSFNGSTVYIRFRINEEQNKQNINNKFNTDKDPFQIFSPLYTPTLDPFEKFECHIGLSYNRYNTKFYDIQYRATQFVPLNSTTVLQKIEITNHRQMEIELDLIPVVDYSHPDALKQLNNADWVPQTMQSKIYRPEQAQPILLQYPFFSKEWRVNYITANAKVSSFQSDRRKFLGKNGYGTWSAPEELKNKKLSDYEALRGDNIGALLIELGRIKPGETKTIIVQYGQTESIEQILPSIQKFYDSSQFDYEFSKLNAFWQNHFSKVKIQTPNDAMNQMLNLFNPYQCYTTFNWSRFLSLYQLGLGARGIGFRDSAQDVLGIIDRTPQNAKILIEKLLSVQLRDGSAMHQFFPLTMQGMRGDSETMEDRDPFYGDDHLWIIFSICEYLKETGDYDFLEKKIPFYEKNPDDCPLECGSVWDHIVRALNFTKTHCGVHNLPLLGFADWNDSVNLRKGAESMFIANLYGAALRETIELLEFLGKRDQQENFQNDYDEMKTNFNACAWDGEYFIRYLDVNGTPIGSSLSTKSKIYANGQSWPILSGFADNLNATLALESVNKYLNTIYGIKLNYPSFNNYDPNIGGITTYPPGAKENGGIFLHANPWVIIAETIVGNGDRAFQYYNQINPANRNDQIELFEVEPYVYPQNILGNEHPQFGLGRNSWLSGTASWCYQAGIKFILGVKPHHKGLQINPCIPKEWDKFEIMRQFRGSNYIITVSNPNHVNKGVRSISIDGNEIQSPFLPIFEEGETHHIEVVLGD